MVVASFLTFLGLFVAIGAYSVTRADKTDSDYLLAGRSVNPWLAAMSAVSTNNSGFMFIGLIGTTYTSGLSSVWVMVGWVLGDWITWFFVHRRLREVSGERNLNTISGFLASEDKDRSSRPIAIVAALITIAFLGAYAAAQLDAGGKALKVIFEWPDEVGKIIGAVIIVVYCFSGGIRASIWTDTAQAIVMILSMTLLFGTALVETGGFDGLWQRLANIDPQLVSFEPKNLQFGFALYVLGWFGAGAGVIGQPHIMIRAMALRSPDDMKLTRRIYFVWYLIFTVAAIGVGLACRVLLPEVQGFDPELSLPLLAKQLLPGALVGMILAGLFSATMSTADSQVLSCSASLTQDLLPKNKNPYLMAKLGTIGVAAVALLIALFWAKGVFALVTLAWSALASGLGPLLVVRVMKKPITDGVGVAMMVTGIATVLTWRYVLELNGAIYEVLPGMVSGLAVYAVAAILRGKNADVGRS